jgi:MurNAc alpha-1-phosphate uridylyltransferase
MRAMILAAGRGERLRPLTDELPKPLVKVCGEPLIAYSLWNLHRAGVREVVINVHYMAEKIMRFLGNGQAFGLDIQYSVEDPVLETGGGILQALPLLGTAPFIVTSADIWTDFDFTVLKNIELKSLAHLILVPNPSYHLSGDFALSDTGLIIGTGLKKTFANISVLNPDLFRDLKPGAFRLGPVLKQAVSQALVTGKEYLGAWMNVGTLEELRQLELQLHT